MQMRFHDLPFIVKAKEKTVSKAEKSSKQEQKLVDL